MALAAQVTWASTEGTSGATVQQLGGTVKRLFGKANWQLDPKDVVACIEQDEWKFFVELEGEKAWLEVEEAEDGQKILSLTGDAEAEAVFASLPEQPDQ